MALGDPLVIGNGDLWYNRLEDRIKFKEAGTLFAVDGSMVITTTTLLNAVTMPTTSAVVQPITRHKTFQVIISGVAVVLVEVSSDNNTFIPLVPGLGTTGIVVDDSPWKFVRVRASTISAGSVTVIMSEGG